MNITILKDEQRTARKPYRCDAFAWFMEHGMSRDDLDTDEQVMFDAVVDDRGHILPGQAYRYVRGVHEGAMFTWRERIDMGSICRDHGLYDD